MHSKEQAPEVTGGNEKQKTSCKFLPPLVEGVDVPDDALSKDLHLVHDYEGTEGEGREALHHDGIGGAVTLEHLVGEDALLLVFRHASLGQLSLHLSRSLALHESLSLSQEVGQEQLWGRRDFIITERMHVLS